ncbi:HlyD family efflux transporter periplasmic adaptor subunit [Phormidium sp. FACHB-592]|uniref:HlyD family secretion protein n=1 Tax=Stenomitos frigidus AS-A4 TaxID=2933935 RepID=A0ABV0KJ53_9CYAN|nr:HlyD family efflux transporter periplasmic adaptor subunit [Phormidium sp. FACHB-592]MBD2078187.1 HlyD family efflux transporter periplasmic adaptor subunit [Phormidium sp. FACHB-592]
MLEVPVKRSYSDHAIGLPLEVEPKQSRWQRLMLTLALVSLGATAVAFGLSSISYRLTHLTIDTGIVNGRTVRVQSPINGTIKAFYAQPGAVVKQGQVLARIAPTPQDEQNILRLQGEISSLDTQIAASQQSLALLQQQLRGLESQDQSIQGANVELAGNDIRRYQAAVDEASAKARSARSDYERYSQLMSEGAVAQQKVDQLKALWQSTEAEVKQAEAVLASAKTSHTVLREGTAFKADDSLLSQRVSLAQTIQTQSTLLKTLEVQRVNKKNLLAQAQAIYTSRKDLTVKAPFSGVIYRTEQEQDAQVNRPSNLLTMLDCSNLWVETLVSVDQANRIDGQQPVRVQLAGEPKTLIGDVDLIESVSTIETIKEQTQAITPATPANLINQPLVRVTVRIPPSAQQTQAHRFCGTGQTAKLTFGTR